MANSDNKAFDMMTAIADESRIDISGYDILPEIPKGSAVSKSDKRLSVGQVKAKKSFDTFIKRLLSQKRWFGEDLSESQISKLKEFWEAGGKPIIEIKERGTKGGLGDVNRAFFTDLPVIGDSDKHVDKMSIYDIDLLGDFQAEISHSMKYAKQEGESDFEWLQRRERLNRTVSAERSAFGERTYGYELPAGRGREIEHGISTKDRKFFPVTVPGKLYSIGEKEGKEVVVDEEGKVYPEMEVPEWAITYDKEGKETGRSRGTSWAINKYKNVEFDPKTRLGVGGQSLTQEFDAHSVVEDSLWNVYNQLYE